MENASEVCERFYNEKNSVNYFDESLRQLKFRRKMLRKRPLPSEERYITPEQYLKMDRQAEYKSEYFNGEIFAMAGASRKHNLIVFNLSGILHGQLRNRSCEAYTSDMRVNVSPTGLYTYPDLVVVCGTPEFKDDQNDILLNPTVIFEVLFESAEHYNRGKKFEHYRTVSSLSDYLLVAQDTCRVEYYTRQTENRWLFSEYKNINEMIIINSIECKLSLKDIYKKTDI